MRRGLAPFAVLLAAALLSSCGGGGASSAPTVQQSAVGEADPAYAARAEAICRQAVRQTQRLGREFAHAEVSPTAPDLLAVTTEYLVRPGIAIRARMARRLRGLPPPSKGQASVAAYLELFDPLEALSRERLRAGVQHDLEEAQRLEKLMLVLSEEQQVAAEVAGLDACATDFVGEAFGSKDSK